MMILHGEQKVTLHRPIPPSGKLQTVAEVTGIYDKGKGARCVVEATPCRAPTGNASERYERRYEEDENDDDK